MNASTRSCRVFALEVLGIVLLAVNSSSAALIGHWTFDANLSNSGTGGATYDAVVLAGSPQAGWTGGTFSGASRPGGISGNGLNLNDVESDNIRLNIGSGGAGTAGALGSSFVLSSWYYLAPTTSPQNTSVRYFLFEASNNFDVSYGSSTPGNIFTSYLGEVAQDSETTSLNNWHHVLHSVSTNGPNSVMSVYIDGVEQPAGTSVATSSINFPSIHVGRARAGTADDRDFDGVVDDFAIWDNESLTDGEAIAVYNLMTSGLNYNAGFAEELYLLHDLATGSDVVNGTTWYYTTGLAGSVGSVTALPGGNYAVKLTSGGTGVTTLVPEPGSFAMLALGAITMWFFRKK